MRTSSATPAASSRTTLFAPPACRITCWAPRNSWSSTTPIAARCTPPNKTCAPESRTAPGPRLSPPPSSTRSRTSKKMSATNCRSSAPIPGFPSPSPSAALSTTLPAAISVKSSTPDSRPVSIIAPSARNSQEKSSNAVLCLHCDFEENPRKFQRVIRPKYCLLSGWRWVWCSARGVVPGTCLHRSLPGKKACDGAKTNGNQNPAKHGMDAGIDAAELIVLFRHPDLRVGQGRQWKEQVQAKPKWIERLFFVIGIFGIDKSSMTKYEPAEKYEHDACVESTRWFAAIAD